VATFLILLNLLNSYTERLLSDGFNMTARPIGTSPMKSHRGLLFSSVVIHTRKH